MRRKASEAKGAKGEKVKRFKGKKAASFSPSSPLPTDPLPVSSSLPSSTRIISPSVVIVGAGRLGTALARALASCGYRVDALVTRRARHAARAATLVGTETRALTVTQLEYLPSTDFLFLTTPDDELAQTASRLATLKPLARPTARTPSSMSVTTSARAPSTLRRVALHTSGALSSEALAPLRTCGFAVGSMHPLVAVSEPEAGAESLRRAFYCIEGDRAAVRAARRLVGHLGGQSFSIDTKHKALYHAAAVMASGHTVALFHLATELLARCGVGASKARRVLLPLLSSTFENLSAHAPARALTGTFARADAATVRKHLAALEANDDDATAIYALLGKHALRLAAETDADPAALREIARMLERFIH